MGAYFNTVPAAIEAIFFVHERGSRIALWNLGLVGYACYRGLSNGSLQELISLCETRSGINLGPVISAQICQYEGWHFAFWWQALACGLVLLGTVVAVPEMMYDRTYYEHACERRRELLASGPRSPYEEEEKASPTQKEATLARVVTAPQDVGTGTASRWSQYRVCTGVKSQTPFVQLLLRPLYYVCSPTVIWATLTFSVCFNLLPLAATVYGQIFGSPPYNLSVGGIGLVGGVPPLIGTLIGTFTTGPISDSLAKWLAKRNNGIYEPEYVSIMICRRVCDLADNPVLQRLLTMSLFLVFGGMGFYGWALQESSSWVVPAIVSSLHLLSSDMHHSRRCRRACTQFIAILHVGVSAATISCFSYITDALREGAADALGFVV